MENVSSNPRTIAYMQFDQLGDTYDTFSRSPFRQYLEFPSTFAALGDVTGLAVLDYGCGSGVYTRLLKQRGAKRAVGLDPSPGMIDHARNIEETTHLGAEYILSESLPQDLEGVLDIVLAVYVIPYMTNVEHLEEFFRTAARALRPGGRLVALPSNPGVKRDKSYYERYGFRMYGSPGPEGAEPQPIKLDLCYDTLQEIGIDAGVWSKDRLEDALSKAGFSDITWLKQVLGESEPLGEKFWKPFWEAPSTCAISCTLEGTSK